MLSVPKALMYCKDSAWIHLDATPFYSLMRSSGSVFRLAVVSIFFLMPSWNSTLQTRIRRFVGLLLYTEFVAVLNCVPLYVGNTVLYLIS